jgi:two-component system, NarL family, response regulator NreC
VIPGHLHLARDQADSAWTHQTARPIRVVLADDHAMMRRTLRLLLESEADLEVIAEAGDLETVMRHVREHRPRVLALDLGMPDGSSIEAVRRLRDEVPGLEIVVLTMEESPVFAQQALDAGAIGFVLKDMSDEDLPEAVRRAASGLNYVSPRVAAGLASLLRSRTDDRLGGRGTEVVPLLALGDTSAEIARELHVL